MSDKKIVEIFRDKNGKEPFIEWLESIKDKTSQMRIRNRLRRIELGNLGNYKSLGAGIYELKFSFGPGYRIYFAEVENTVILLLAGGDKSSQSKDIKRAKIYWRGYKELKQ